MKVFTYYSHVDGLKDDDLLTIWKESWARYGWEPIILNEADARAADSAMFQRFQKSELLKSCPGNPVQYTLSAMLRWVAMTAIKENALHVDWDVMCNGLKPSEITIHDPIPTFLAGSTCPCAVAASPRGWRMFAAALEMAPFMPRFNAQDLLKDSCDQYAASIFPTEFAFVQPGTLCRLYQEQIGWQTAPMIHFPNRLTPYPRSATVRKVLASIPRQKCCIVLSHNAGLFSLINKVVTCMDIGYENVAVDFTRGDPHKYVTPGGKNLWDLLFEPMDSKGQKEDEWVEYPDMWLTGGNATKLYTGDQAWRTRLNGWWNRLRVRPEIIDRIEYSMASLGLLGGKFVSILVRSDFHAREQATAQSQSLDSYAVAAQSALQSGDDFYVSAGDDATIKWFQERFNHVKFYPLTRRLKTRELDLLVHSDNTLEDAVNVLIEVLIMSKGRTLIHPVSNMSTAALYMNPELKSVYLP